MAAIPPSTARSGTEDIGRGATPSRTWGLRLAARAANHGRAAALGTIRVTERTPNHSIEWAWEQGVHQSGRWTVRDAGGGTELTLEVRYDLSGGPLGRLVEQLTGRIVERNLWATLLAARRLAEG